MKSRSGFVPILVAIVIAIILIGGGYVVYRQHTTNNLQPNQNNNQTACSQEAKQCPDGSYVTRTGPSCEFAQCPSAALCEGGACPGQTTSSLGLFDYKAGDLKNLHRSGNDYFVRIHGLQYSAIDPHSPHEPGPIIVDLDEEHDFRIDPHTNITFLPGGVLDSFVDAGIIDSSYYSDRSWTTTVAYLVHLFETKKYQDSSLGIFNFTFTNGVVTRVDAVDFSNPKSKYP